MIFKVSVGHFSSKKVTAEKWLETANEIDILYLNSNNSVTIVECEK